MYLSKMDMLKMAVLIKVKRVHEPLVAERGIGF